MAAHNVTQRSWLARIPILKQKGMEFSRRFGISRAVLYNILTQGWSTLAVPVTMLIIASRLTAVEQGYYYTFSSVLALQVFVELGLVTVIVQVASHEWAFLHCDNSGKICGNERALSRLSSLLNFALKWYAASGLIVMLGLGVGGYYFLAAKPHPEINWQLPWFSLSGVAGLALMMSPVLSVIEGCNQVGSIYRLRFLQGILSSSAVIISIVLGLGLYALAIAASIRLLCGMLFIVIEHRTIIHQLLFSRISEHIHWQAEVWPFQWRLGISSLSGYFVFWLFTPVMFYYQSPQVAGQMGMTLTMLAVIEATSFAWINTRMPQFGVLIAQRKYDELDQLFRRLLRITFSVAGTLSLLLICLIYWLQSSQWPIRDRILPLLPTVFFITQRLTNVAISAMAFYLRAHKREPMMMISVTSAILTGACTVLLGRYYGAIGAAIGYAVVTVLWVLPATRHVFHVCSQRWHAAA